MEDAGPLNGIQSRHPDKATVEPTVETATVETTVDETTVETTVDETTVEPTVEPTVETTVESAVESTVESTVDTIADKTTVETTVSEGQPRPRQGLKLVDIDIEESFFVLIQQHAAECGHPLLKVASKNVHRGFDLIATYSCKFCMKQIKQRSSRDASQKGSRGEAPSEINLQIAAGCYSCGIHPSKAHELFTRCGISYVISKPPIAYVFPVLYTNDCSFLPSVDPPREDSTIPIIASRKLYSEYPRSNCCRIENIMLRHAEQIPTIVETLNL
jgi:hypothetical protein